MTWWLEVALGNSIPWFLLRHGALWPTPFVAPSHGLGSDPQASTPVAVKWCTSPLHSGWVSYTPCSNRGSCGHHHVASLYMDCAAIDGSDHRHMESLDPRVCWRKQFPHCSCSSVAMVYDVQKRFCGWTCDSAPLCPAFLVGEGWKD